MVIALLDPEIAPEEVDHRPVARPLAVRDGGALENQPAVQAMRVSDLMDEPGLADPRLSHDRDDLAVTSARQLQRAPQETRRSSCSSFSTTARIPRCTPCGSRTFARIGRPRWWYGGRTTPSSQWKARRPTREI